MNIDWFDLAYLKDGSTLQKKCFQVLTQLRLLGVLKAFDPVFVGTIPIDIAVLGSDIDLICTTSDLASFRKIVQQNWSSQNNFTDEICPNHYVANFDFMDVPIEIYAATIPVRRQNAYRHMCVEYAILQLTHPAFKQEIIRLKSEGCKTEPAFGLLLHIENPYEELYVLSGKTPSELNQFLVERLDPCYLF